MNVIELNKIYSFASNLGSYEGEKLQKRTIKVFFKEAFASQKEDYITLLNSLEVLKEWKSVLSIFQPTNELPDFFKHIHFNSENDEKYYIEKIINSLDLPFELDYENAKFIPDMGVLMAKIAFNVGQGKIVANSKEFIISSNFNELTIQTEALPKDFIQDLIEIEQLVQKFNQSNSVKKQLTFESLLENVKKKYPVKDKMNSLYIEGNLYLF